MSRQEEKLLAARNAMVETQLGRRDIRDQRVLEAFMEVPRERFIPAHHVRDAYADRPIAIGHGQTISQPYVVALTLQELDVRPGLRVLDVGTGSGYQTALLAKLAEHVYAIERISALTERAGATLAELGIGNVTLRTGDGTLGWPENAPFDRIVCGAAAPHVPATWTEQLADGGKIVLPIGPRDSQILLVLEKEGERIRRREICGVRFVPLIGRHGWQQ